MTRRSSKYLIFGAGNHGWIVKDLGFWTWSLMWLKRCHNPMRKNPSPGKKCPIIELAMWARKNYQSVPKTQFLCFEEDVRGLFEMGFWRGLVFDMGLGSSILLFQFAVLIRVWGRKERLVWDELLKGFEGFWTGLMRSSISICRAH